MTKRIFDVVVSAVGLVFLAPLLAVIALCLKLESRQPVLYRQERAGRFGVPFRIHKFRAMQSDADRKGLLITIVGDPRVTAVGKWLRRYKLDELPQLVDVLRGDMSLVGPRPEVSKYVAIYAPEIRDLVLSVRPGITDMASIAFRNESTLLASSRDPELTYIEDVLPIKLRQHAAYVKRHSLFGDVAIILRTLGVLLR